MEYVSIVHGGDHFRGRQAHGNGLALDLVNVEAPAVVAHVDEDLVAALVGVHGDMGRFRLAKLFPLPGGFNAVVNSVPEQVQERLADGVDDFLVQFGFLTLDGEFDILVEFLGEVPHQAAETREDLADGNHPRLHDAALQILGDARHLLHAALEFVDDRFFLADLPHLLIEFEEARVGYNQLADIVQEQVQLVDGDLDGF